jgi:sulfoxide reductase catalytic subunit YedY
MNVIRRRGWEIPDSQLTPDHLFFTRRSFMAGAAATVALSGAAQAQRVSDLDKIADSTADLYPAKRNEKYALDRPITADAHALRCAPS